MRALSTEFLKTTAVGAVIMASVSIGSLAASAADVTVPVADQWTGFYLGAQAGYLQGDIDLDYCFDDGFCASDDGFSYAGLNPDGVTVGGYAGYNFRMDHVVLGLEGDVNWDNAQDSRFYGCGVFCFAEDTLEAELTWDASIRARLGLVVDDSALLYITGGPSWIHEKVSIGSESAFGCCFGGDASDSGTRFGWQLGVGAEYFVTEHLSTKLEYLHGWYGSEDWFKGCDENCWLDTDLETDVVRVGVAYHFNQN